MLFAEVETADQLQGLGISYSKRAGGPGQFAHAREVAPQLIGEDPSDIGRLWTKLVWAGASVGRSGLATQAIAAFDIALWDLKARRAGLPLAKLLGAHRDAVRCYNTSGGFLHEPLEQVLDNATASLAQGIEGIKIKVGQPDWREDVRRVTRLREHVGDDVPLMVDVNQQWDRRTAARMGRILDELRPGVDRGAARRVRRRGARAPGPDPVDAGGLRRDADQRARAPRPGRGAGRRRAAARRRARRRDHRVPAAGDDRGAAPAAARAPLRDGAAPAPRRRLPATRSGSSTSTGSSRCSRSASRSRTAGWSCPERPGLGLTLSEQARAWTVETATIDASPPRSQSWLQASGSNSSWSPTLAASVARWKLPSPSRWSSAVRWLV